MNNTQNTYGNVVPMFLPQQMEQPMASNDQTQQNKQTELSIFDVKELYDLAYSYELQDTDKFKTILAQAVKLDLEYRRQLTKRAIYKDTSKEKTFKEASDGKKAIQG